MLDRTIAWRRAGVAFAALATGVVLFWLALHCGASDWRISETHADIIYTGLHQFREFPYFSFVFGGGTYFLQDPQSNLFSAAVPLIYLAGPSIGLRLMEGLWGVAGVYAFVGWIRRRGVSVEAALVGAVASATGLGVLWRVAIGNDMFMWHLGLPFLLWTVDGVLRERGLQSALWFALALGVLMLGPTFHSFTYLFLPVVPIYTLLELIHQRPKPRELAKVVGLFTLGGTLAVLMISFKLAAWLEFPMKRAVGDFGVLPLATSLRQLFDFSLVNRVAVVTSRFVGKPSHIGWHAWGSEETGTALSPLATLLAGVGVLGAALSPSKRRLGLFALILFVLGLTLTSWSPAWEAFRRLNGGNFRVSPRCLGMCAFALSVFSALGADVLFSRVKRAALPLSLATVVVLCGSALWWTQAAARTGEEIVSPAWMNPLEIARAEKEAASKVRSFDRLRRYRGRRDILDGTGYTDGFLVVGNEYDPNLWFARRELPILYDGHKKANVGRIKQSQITTEHFRVKIRSMPPRSRMLLRLREPKFGLKVTTIPPNAGVIVRPKGNLLSVENPTRERIERIVLRAPLPISSAWLIVAGLALFSTIGGLCWFADLARSTHSAPEPSL